MTGYTTENQNCTIKPLESIEELQYGAVGVTIGNSKLIWDVDRVEYGTVHLSRQHMRGGRGHHLSFRNLSTSEAVAKLNLVTYLP